MEEEKGTKVEETKAEVLAPTKLNKEEKVAKKKLEVFTAIKKELLEKKENIKENFYRIGILLIKIKEEELYTGEHTSFNEFLRANEIYPGGYKMIRLVKLFPAGLPVGILKAEKIARLCELNPALTDKAVQVAKDTPLSGLDEQLAETFKEDFAKLHTSPQAGHLHFSGDQNQINIIKKAIEVLIANKPDDYGTSPLEVLEGVLVNAVEAENLTGLLK